MGNTDSLLNNSQNPKGAEKPQLTPEQIARIENEKTSNRLAIIQELVRFIFFH